MEAWWHLAWQTLQAEFADIGDARQLTQVTVRLLIAAILGGILGFEREIAQTIFDAYGHGDILPMGYIPLGDSHVGGFPATDWRSALSMLYP